MIGAIVTTSLLSAEVQVCRSNFNYCYYCRLGRMETTLRFIWRNKSKAVAGKECLLSWGGESIAKCEELMLEYRARYRAGSSRSRRIGCRSA